MPTDEITDRQIQAFKRFITRLPHGMDIDLVILKAHLLIEEEVNAILRARLKNPESILSEERFESIYRIRLAQGFFEPDFQPWLWHALTQLNKLRNRVAHSIDPKGRENIMEDIVEAVPGAGGKDEDTRSRSTAGETGLRGRLLQRVGQRGDLDFAAQA